MQTVNGKLILEEAPKLDEMNQNIENLTQEFQNLELQMTTMSKTDKTEYIEQIIFVQLSLQKLERIYSRLLSTTILSAICLVSWYFWLSFNHESVPGKLANPKVGISSIRTIGGASR